MYELFDGIISIVGGIYCYLTAIGVVKLRKNEKDATAWLNKYGTFLKLVAAALIIFGVYTLSNHFELL
jgi:hypothetical protein